MATNLTLPLSLDESVRPLRADVLLTDGALAVVRTLEPGDGAMLHELHERVSDDAAANAVLLGGPSAPHTRTWSTCSARRTHSPWRPRCGDGSSPLRPPSRSTPGPARSRSSSTTPSVARGSAPSCSSILPPWRVIAEFAGSRPRCWQRTTGCSGSSATPGSASNAGSTRVCMCWRWTRDVTPAVQDAADRREFGDETRSLAPLLAPRSVAVYGVRRDGSGIGATALRSIRERRLPRRARRDPSHGRRSRRGVGDGVPRRPWSADRPCGDRGTGAARGLRPGGRRQSRECPPRW